VYQYKCVCDVCLATHCNTLQRMSHVLHRYVCPAVRCRTNKSMHTRDICCSVLQCVAGQTCPCTHVTCVAVCCSALQDKHIHIQIHIHIHTHTPCSITECDRAIEGGGMRELDSVLYDMCLSKNTMTVTACHISYVIHTTYMYLHLTPMTYTKYETCHMSPMSQVIHCMYVPTSTPCNIHATRDISHAIHSI